MMINKKIILTALLLSFTLSSPSMAKDKDIKVNKGKSDQPTISQGNKQSAEDSLRGLDRAQERISDQDKAHSKGSMAGKKPGMKEDKKEK